MRKGLLFSIIVSTIYCALVSTAHADAVTPQFKLTASDGSYRDRFGNSISIDGDCMIIGASGYDKYGGDCGAAYIFRYNGSAWAQEATLIPTEAVSAFGFGHSVSIDGNFAVIGVPEENTYDGAVFVYKYNGISWVQHSKLMINYPDRAGGKDFGYSVSIDGDWIIAGAYSESLNGTYSGAAYIFNYDGTSWQQHTKLTVSDGYYFGQSVYIDGNLAVVGAPHDYYEGAAYVFHYDGSSWNRQAKLIASDGLVADRFGNSVSIDGNEIIVGAFTDDDHGENSGSAYIFRKDGSSWNEEAKLTANDAAAEDTFGNSVSIDGDYAIVGAMQNSSDPGSSYIFKYDGSSWNQHTKLTAEDGTHNDHFGSSVDICGEVFVVGAQGSKFSNNNKNGAVYVLDKRIPSLSAKAESLTENYFCSGYFGDSLEPSEKSYILTNNDNVKTSWTAATDQPWLDINPAEGTLQVGDSTVVTVSLNSNANNLPIGTHRGKINFNNINKDIQQTNEVKLDILVPSTKLLADDGAAGDRFGISVAIDGDYAFVGAWYDDDHGENSGSVYVYHNDSTSWTQLTKLTPDDAAEGDYFGFSVSVDGNYVIVGAMGDADNGSSSGSAYIFHYDGSSWIQQAKLTADDAAVGDNFGYSVSINNNVAIVSAIRDDDHGSESGSVYIFRYDGSSWTQQAKLTPDDGAYHDRFGYSLAIDGNTLMVGAYEDDDFGADSGSVYIFYYDGSSWVQQAKLNADDAAGGDYFGVSVSIDKDYAIVGATGNDDFGYSNSGSAYIFHYDGATWTQQAKLIATGERSLFGCSVSIHDKLAIVSTPGASYHGQFPGQAYIYSYDGSSWLRQTELTAVDLIGTGRASFGFDIDSSDGVFIISALNDRTLGESAGSAYIFDARAFDHDGDNIPDNIDSCLDKYNPGQSDVDNDGTGDVCDTCPSDPQNECDPLGSAAKEIDPEKGGVLETPDGNLVIVIEPNDISEPATVSVTKILPNDPNVDLIIGSNSGKGKALAVYDLHPEGMVFDQPVTVIVTADVTDLNQNQRDRLGFYWWDESTNKFVLLDNAACGVVEDPAGTFTMMCVVELQHFSKYALLQLLNTPPVANAGQDQSVYAFIDGNAQIKLDGTASYDEDNDELTYSWYQEYDLIATGPNPSVTLGVGVHQVDLIVNDGTVDSETSSCSITVIEALQREAKMMPQSLNRKSTRTHVIGRLQLTGINYTDLDLKEPMLLMPGNFAARRVKVLPAKKRDGSISMIGFFNRAKLLNAVKENGDTEVTIAAKLKSGQWIYGRQIVKIIGKPKEPKRIKTGVIKEKRSSIQNNRSVRMHPKRSRELNRPRK